MAFNVDYLGRVNTSANSQALKVWTYNGTDTGTDETVATIVASGYFNAFQQKLTSGAEFGPLAVGDVMFIHGNDASGMYTVTSISTNVTLGAFASAGTIDTANLADGAVTTPKLAADAVDNTKLADDAVSLENLDDDIAPSHIVKFAGKESDAGGDATVTITEAGVLTTDIVFAQVQASTNAVSVQKVTPTTDTITVLLSGDPDADTVISYQVLREAA